MKKNFAMKKYRCMEKVWKNIRNYYVIFRTKSNGNHFEYFFLYIGTFSSPNYYFFFITYKNRTFLFIRVKAIKQKETSSQFYGNKSCFWSKAKGTLTRKERPVFVSL